MHGNPVLRTAETSTLLLRRHRRGMALFTLCLAVLIAQIDTSLVNLGTHPIAAYFGASVGTLQWVVDAYNLVYAVLLLTGGQLADRLGRRRVFMAGAALFTAASLLSAAAPSVAILIGGRALAGIGAALLLPASLAMVRVVWPDAKERAAALGVWAGCNGLAFAIGPSAGGLLIGHFGWRSLFLVVVPFGLAALGLAVPTLPESSDPTRRPFDLPAQILGALALGGLALAAIEHASVVAAGVVLGGAIIAGILFIKLEIKRGASALVPIDLFRIGRFRGAFVGTAGMTFGMYGVIFLLPLLWQSSGGLDSTTAGLALMPMALAFVCVSAISGLLTEKVGPGVMMSGGVAMIGCGLLAVGVAAPSGHVAAEQIGLVLAGLGMGLATAPLMGGAIGAVAAERSGTAAALINVARMAGATMGVAVLGALFASAGAGWFGLSLAMLAGGLVQLVAAAVIWRTAGPRQAARG